MPCKRIFRWLREKSELTSECVMYCVEAVPQIDREYYFFVLRSGSVYVVDSKCDHFHFYDGKPAPFLMVPRLFCLQLWASYQEDYKKREKEGVKRAKMWSGAITDLDLISAVSKED